MHVSFKKNHLKISKFKPIQVTSLSFDNIKNKANTFSTSSWREAICSFSLFCINTETNRVIVPSIFLPCYKVTGKKQTCFLFIVLCLSNLAHPRKENKGGSSLLMYCLPFSFPSTASLKICSPLMNVVVPSEAASPPVLCLDSAAALWQNELVILKKNFYFFLESIFVIKYHKTMRNLTIYLWTCINGLLADDFFFS